MEDSKRTRGILGRRQWHGNTRELAAGSIYRLPRSIEFTETRNENPSSDGS